MNICIYSCNAMALCTVDAVCSGNLQHFNAGFGFGFDTMSQRGVVFALVSQPIALTCSCTHWCTVQVGVVQAGQASPFWARQQPKLLLKVTTAHPASLVQLVRDSEVAVAPRPRRTLAQQNVLKETDLKSAPASSQQEPVKSDIWLRLLVKLCLCSADSCICWSAWSALTHVQSHCFDTCSAIGLKASGTWLFIHSCGSACHISTFSIVQLQRSYIGQTPTLVPSLICIMACVHMTLES